jgi:hypothetical protein
VDGNEDLERFLVAAGLLVAAIPLKASAEPIATTSVKRCGNAGGPGFGGAGRVTAKNMSCGFAERSPGTS